MPRDIDMLRRLRAAGLKVVEVDGWQTRGSTTFTPRGSVDHHTAGPAKGNAPSLGICVNGRADLPGPLCHVLVGRDLTCYLIAAGRANHAGLGGWKGLSGNSSVYGVERENVGTAVEPWRPDQLPHAAAVHRALIDGKATADMVCRHAEWAPTRKVDTHSVSGTQLRTLIATPPSGDDDMALTPEDKDWIRALLTDVAGTRTPSADADGAHRSEDWRWSKETVEKLRSLSTGGTVVDYAKVEAACEKAVRDVLGSLA